MQTKSHLIVSEVYMRRTVNFQDFNNKMTSFGALVTALFVAMMMSSIHKTADSLSGNIARTYYPIHARKLMLDRLGDQLVAEVQSLDLPLRAHRFGNGQEYGMERGPPPAPPQRRIRSEPNNGRRVNLNEFNYDGIFVPGFDYETKKQTSWPTNQISNCKLTYHSIATSYGRIFCVGNRLPSQNTRQPVGGQRSNRASQGDKNDTWRRDSPAKYPSARMVTSVIANERVNNVEQSVWNELMLAIRARKFSS